MNNFWLQLHKPILALAPMEGVTDSPMRQICKRFGADVVYTEFMSADAIAYGAPKVLAKMAFREVERPVVCQIFGRDPAKFAIAAKKVQELGFDGLDINFGCPAKKVVGHGSGVALLRDPQYARRLIEAALEHITIPLSIKVRTSIRKEVKDIEPGCPDRYTALDLVTAIKDLPVSTIMVHGRGFEQGHSGDIDTAMIKEVKQHFGGIVLANGGIYSPDDAQSMLQNTGTDGIGIARGAWGRPWIFRQIREALDGHSATATDLQLFTQTILNHANQMHQVSSTHGLIEFRKHLIRYFHGRANAAQLRVKAGQVTTLDDVRRITSLIT